jgi:hypothetical protein
MLIPTLSRLGIGPRILLDNGPQVKLLTTDSGALRDQERSVRSASAGSAAVAAGFVPNGGVADGAS